MNITTNGTHANAVFSYGDWTVVDISDSNIETSGDADTGLSKFSATGGSISNANGYTLTVDGKSYEQVNTVSGEAIEIKSEENGGKGGPGGFEGTAPPDKPYL